MGVIPLPVSPCVGHIFWWELWCYCVRASWCPDWWCQDEAGTGPSGRFPQMCVPHPHRYHLIYVTVLEPGSCAQLTLSEQMGQEVTLRERQMAVWKSPHRALASLRDCCWGFNQLPAGKVVVCVQSGTNTGGKERGVVGGGVENLFPICCSHKSGLKLEWLCCVKRTASFQIQWARLQMIITCYKCYLPNQGIRAPFKLNRGIQWELTCHCSGQGIHCHENANEELQRWDDIH